MASMADLEFLFYGGGSDEKLAFLQNAADAEITGADMLAMMTGEAFPADFITALTLELGL